MENYLENLNDMQAQAVTTTEGPVLVLAGAGSGKTTVLVKRIAYIIAKKKVAPYQILAITFTNKAANEMRERIDRLIGETAKDMWVSTFHSACVRILRATIDLIGYEKDFVIYDSTDTKTLLKECLRDLNMDEKAYAPKSVQGIISNAKDNMQTPEIFESVNSANYHLQQVAKVYKLYQRRLKENNALDFDDIVLLTVKILMENPDVLDRYSNRFRYIMVDEYQDTNNVQYMLISLLSQRHQNICVVGDDDQSIYKFRGANIQNILGFEEEFPDAKVIKLEQNYRSTQNILDAANAVIANNRGRKGKSLWTENVQGDKIRMYTGDNERGEASFIAEKINELIKEGKTYSDFAVLYRTNAQSRIIEEMLMRFGIPYRVLAGLRFYDRKEIKDVIAYLRVIQNPRDAVSIKRIINEPKRGIGAASMEKASELADAEGKTLFDVLKNADRYQPLLRASSKIEVFVKLIETLQNAVGSMSLVDFVTRVMTDSGYLAALELENTVESRARLENLQEFLSVVKEYEISEEEASLGNFLENLALVSEIDAYDEDQESVVMMTIHSAKGLEFPVVFLVGMEDGIFPSMRSTEPEDLEEERRLCYVAITRAKKLLYITKTVQRMLYGKTSFSTASRFLDEIPSQFLEDITPIKKQGNVQQFQSLFRDVRKTEIYQPEKKPTSLPAEIDFAPGDRVEHKKFGQGIILSVKPFEKDAMLEINFDSVGRKQLMAVFAKLKKL